MSVRGDALCKGRFASRGSSLRRFRGSARASSLLIDPPRSPSGPCRPSLGRGPSSPSLPPDAASPLRRTCERSSMRWRRHLSTPLEASVVRFPEGSTPQGYPSARFRRAALKRPRTKEREAKNEKTKKNARKAGSFAGVEVACEVAPKRRPLRVLTSGSTKCRKRLFRSFPSMPPRLPIRRLRRLPQQQGPPHGAPGT